MDSAAICGFAPTPTPGISAPTASAARSRCWACSCPAGACICPTWRSRSAISFARSATSALDPEQLLDTELERRGELDRQRRRWREHPIFNRVHGLASNADLLGQLGLGESELAAAILQAVGEALRHPGARGARACRI